VNFKCKLFSDHPYIEERETVLGDRDSPVRAPDTSEDSLHLHLSLSEEDQSTNDSFVTCAGEVNDSFVMCAGGCKF